MGGAVVAEKGGENGITAEANLPDVVCGSLGGFLLSDTYTFRSGAEYLRSFFGLTTLAYTLRDKKWYLRRSMGGFDILKV